MRYTSIGFVMYKPYFVFIETMVHEFYSVNNIIPEAVGYKRKATQVYNAIVVDIQPEALLYSFFMYKVF